MAAIMDVEKTVQFLLEQQAQFAAQQQQLAAQQQQFQRDLEDLRGVVGRLAGVVQGVVGVTQQLGGVTQQLAQIQDRQQQQIGELIAAQKHTDERLDALIKVVDDLVRRNGSGRQSV